MKRKALLALGLFVLASVALQASGRQSNPGLRHYDMTRHYTNGAKSTAPDATFSYVGLINDEGATVMGLGWMGETTDYTTMGDGLLQMSDFHGNIRLQALADVRFGGWIAVYDTGGNVAAYMDAEEGFWSKRGDLAESFAASVPFIEAGSVVILDSDNPGSLISSTEAYDRRVAGVVAGANDYKPGIALGAKNLVNGVQVTLTGTAYCKVTNSNGAITAGDLLTTSGIAGHAMRATDAEKSRGAILGKAMQNFDGDSGLIMILTSLQ